MVRAELIGGTTDISAGQLVDRIGVSLGMDFPAGKAMDALSRESDQAKHFTVKMSEGKFSLSGMENKIGAMVEKGDRPADIARYTFETLASVLARATAWAKETYGDLPVLCSGGVASNTLLRSRLEPMGTIFAPAKYSTDNALGVAILAHRCLERGEGE